MAQFFTDFTEYTPDTVPSDWSEFGSGGEGIIRNSSIPSGGGAQAMESNGSMRFQWDTPGVLGNDVEVLAKVLQTSMDSGSARVLLHNDTPLGENSNYYLADNGSISFSSGLVLEKFIDDSNDRLGSGAGIYSLDDTWYWVRLQRTAADDGIRVRAWNDADPEPGTWTIETTDTDLTGGNVGVLRVAGGTLWVAQFGVGTNGDSAPDEAVMGIDSVTPSTFADSDTGITIAGSGFGSTQGTGKVEIANNSDYGSATVIEEQTVTSWSDTSIDFTAVRGSLDVGTNYVFVTSDGGDRVGGEPITLEGVNYNQGISGSTGVLSGALTTARTFGHQVSGTLSNTSGNLLREVQKSLSGTQEQSGLLNRFTSVTRVGSLSNLTGTVVGEFIATISVGGSLAMSGTVDTAKTWAKAVSGSISGLSNTLTRAINFNRAGSLSPTGVNSKFTSISISGAVGSLSATLGTLKTYVIALSGSISSVSGAISRQTNKVLSASLSPTGIAGILYTLTVGGTLSVLSGGISTLFPAKRAIMKGGSVIKNTMKGGSVTKTFMRGGNTIIRKMKGGDTRWPKE